MKRASACEWAASTLGDSFRIVTGNTPPKAKTDLYGDAIPFVKPPELTNGEVNSATNGLSEKGLEIARIAPEGSTLVSCIGNLGKIGLTTRAVAFNQQINAIFPEPRVTLPKFVYYLTLSPGFRDQLFALSSGTTVPIVNKTRFNSIELSIPPLDEQKRIVAVLDQAFAALDRARAHAEANLADAQELFETTKQSVLDVTSQTGRAVTLSDVSSIESTLVDPRECEFMDLPHIGAGNMATGSDALVEVKTARQEKLKSGKYLFSSKDVLYSKIRPYLRKAARPDSNGLCSADVYPLRPGTDLDRDFLFHLLLGRKFTEYAIAGSARAGMPKVNRRHLFNYEFCLPPLARQHGAAAKIDSALIASNELQRLFEAKLADIADLRQSILQKAFAGQLT